MEHTGSILTLIQNQTRLRLKVFSLRKLLYLNKRLASSLIPYPFSPFPFPLSIFLFSLFRFFIFPLPFSNFPLPFWLFAFHFSFFTLPYSLFTSFHFPFYFSEEVICRINSANSDLFAGSAYLRINPVKKCLIC